MADIKDRIPSNLHPVCGWIMMAAEFPDNVVWSDLLYGWSCAIDGAYVGPTWSAICKAIRDEAKYLNG